MKNHLKPILAALLSLVIICTISTHASAKISPKKMYSIRKQWARECSDNTVKMSVSMKKVNGRYIYTTNIRLKQVNSTIAEWSQILAKKSMNQTRKKFKSVNKYLYKQLKKYKIKGDDYMNVIMSDNYILWQFKNGKQTYSYFD